MERDQITADQRVLFTPNPQSVEDEIEEVACTVVTAPDPDDPDDPWVQVTMTMWVRADELTPIDDEPDPT